MFKKTKLFVKAPENSGGGSAVIDELNVTPSTSAQTITAPTGTDGYSPVNVSAVTAAIDNNITAGNIKSGVSILGVSGSVTELNGSTETVTPTTSQQTITPTSPSNGLTSVTVNAVTSAIDANIVAENIKKDVQILGVTGSLESGITPTGTKNITANGVYDVTNYASADVQVPTTAPAHYVEKSVDANGKLVNSGTMINLTGVTDIGNRGLYSEYYQGTFPADTTIDMSGLTQITGEFACYSMFSYASGIKVVNLNNLTTVQGRYACGQMFNYASGITNVDLSSLTTISGQYGCSEMFSNAVVNSVDMSSLTTVGTYACYNMFNVATISNIDLSSLTTVDVAGCSAMFRYARNIESVIFNSLTTVADQGLREGFESCASIKTVEFNKVNSIAGVNAFYHTFSGCTKLESIKFGGFKASTIIYPNIIGSLFNAQTGSQAPNGCTVHFPSNFDPSDPNHTFDASTLTNYPTFGGSASYIHVAFDLPATE